MKKIITLCLSLCLTATLAAPAYALEYSIDAPDDYDFGRDTSIEVIHTADGGAMRGESRGCILLSTRRQFPAILEKKKSLRRASAMKNILFVCHGNILRSPEKAYYINGFHRSNGAYYTTITPFAKEL